MKFKSIWNILFLSLIVLSISASAQEEIDWLSKGNQLYKEFKNQEALEAYQKADSASPKNWDVLWRISRAYVDLAEKMPNETGDEEDAQLATFEKALMFADSSINLAPDQSEPYLRKAIANGKIALFKGVFSVAGVVNQVKEDCEKAILQGTGGNITQGVAHYVLARTHAKISEKWAPARSVLGLGWADIDSALVHYEKAKELYPNFIMIYVDYAISLIEEDEYDKARELLNMSFTLPKLDEDDETRLAEAKALLEEIADE
jgi:tetratricopeptide (TPR) repeat protein